MQRAVKHKHWNVAEGRGYDPRFAAISPGVGNDACSRRYSTPRSPSRMTISHGTWTPAYSQLCASIVRIQVLYGDNMSKPNIRKITADPTKCNTDSSRRPSVFERLGTKPAITAAAAAQNTSDYCRNWALNGSCSYGKSCKWADFICHNSSPRNVHWIVYQLIGHWKILYLHITNKIAL